MLNHFKEVIVCLPGSSTLLRFRGILPDISCGGVTSHLVGSDEKSKWHGFKTCKDTTVVLDSTQPLKNCLKINVCGNFPDRRFLDSSVGTQTPRLWRSVTALTSEESSFSNLTLQWEAFLPVTTSGWLLDSPHGQHYPIINPKPLHLDSQPTGAFP